MTDYNQDKLDLTMNAGECSHGFMNESEPTMFAEDEVTHADVI